jgi:hypothetical protein
MTRMDKERTSQCYNHNHRACKANTSHQQVLQFCHWKRTEDRAATAECKIRKAKQQVAGPSLEIPAGILSKVLC